MLPKILDFNEIVHPIHASSFSLRSQRDDDRSQSTSSFQTMAKLPEQKIITFNDQSSNTMLPRLHLQLTPPHRTVKFHDTIPCIERSFCRIENGVELEISLSNRDDDDEEEEEETIRSKGKVLIGQHADIRPVFEIYNDNYHPNKQMGFDYQSRNKDYFERSPLSDTYSDSLPLVPPIPLETKKQCNYREAAAGSRCNPRQNFPRNRVLALALSKHGVYLPRRFMEQPIYAHLALNNIHNIKPFGSYKLTDGL